MSRIATESSKYYALALHTKSQRSDKNEKFEVYAGCIKLKATLISGKISIPREAKYLLRFRRKLALTGSK